MAASDPQQNIGASPFRLDIALSTHLIGPPAGNRPATIGAADWDFAGGCRHPPLEHLYLVLPCGLGLALQQLFGCHGHEVLLWSRAPWRCLNGPTLREGAAFEVQ